MEQAQDALIALFVISMMLAVGLDLTIAQLRAVLHRPRAIAGGMAACYLAVPLAAVGVVQLLGLPTAVAAGLLLCAAAPGGPLGALFTQRARGDLALVVALMILVNVVNVFATPFTLQLLGATPGEDLVRELLGMSGTIVVFQILPLGTGVAMRERLTAETAGRIATWAKRVANGMLAVLCVGMVLFQSEILLQLPLSSLAAAELTVLAALAAGWLLVPGDRRAKTGGALFNGVRSQSLAILLASTRFETPETLLMTICYSLVMFFNCLAAAELLRRVNASAFPTERAS